MAKIRCWPKISSFLDIHRITLKYAEGMNIFEYIDEESMQVICQWHSTREAVADIPINVSLLISDGYEVYVGFYDSMHEWYMDNQELCEDIDFDVLFWMPLPEPPQEV